MMRLQSLIMHDFLRPNEVRPFRHVAPTGGPVANRLTGTVTISLKTQRRLLLSEEKKTLNILFSRNISEEQANLTAVAAPLY